MDIRKRISRIKTIFLDTAPVIYFIEAHEEYGSLVKIIVDAFQSGQVKAYLSVITIAEVLPKPVSEGEEELVAKFLAFLKHGENLTLLEITSQIAERAGRLRSKYESLKTVDALQISSAIAAGADVFVTNDIRLKVVKEIDILVLKDYL